MGGHYKDGGSGGVSERQDIRPEPENKIRNIKDTMAIPSLQTMDPES